MLTYATVYGSIVGWDLRAPGTAWKLENGPRKGLLRFFVIINILCIVLLYRAAHPELLISTTYRWRYKVLSRECWGRGSV